MPKDWSTPSVRDVQVEYALRDGHVSEYVPLTEIERFVETIPCPNPACRNGGFHVNPYVFYPISQRCIGYERLTGNLSRLCNYWIRYRVRPRYHRELLTEVKK
jgi:hypothetical protein